MEPRTPGYECSSPSALLAHGPAPCTSIVHCSIDLVNCHL